MRFILPVIAAFVLVASAEPARAEIENYTLENPHTQIIFSVNHLGFSNSYGKFLDYDGTIIFNRSEPEKSKVDVVIKTASIDMAHDKWNEHLKNADFFDVEKFPEMTFKSTGIKVTGEKTADITGDLTIKGVTKPVTLTAVFNKADKHPMGDQYAAGFSADTTIKRSDFGITYGLPMVGEDVKIHIEVEAIRDTPASNQ